MTAYFDALIEAMSLLAQNSNTIFLGQSVRYPGTAMYNTLSHIPASQRIEMPVAENMQLGCSIGLAVQGFLPINIFPRINFLLCATDALVLHLDKISIYSDGGYRPRVIIRTGIATNTPMDPGPQHLGDFGAALAAMLETVQVRYLTTAEQVLPAYQDAITRDGSTLMIEMLEKYG